VPAVNKPVIPMAIAATAPTATNASTAMTRIG
jgi:hypothetical protein